MTDTTNITIAATQLRAIDTALGGGSAFASMAQSIETYMNNVGIDEANAATQIADLTANLGTLPQQIIDAQAALVAMTAERDALKAELTKIKADTAQLTADEV